MTCTEARELLLEADLDALRGEGPSALARHVAACARCRALAGQVLDEQAALDRVLAHLAERAHPAGGVRRTPPAVRVAAWGLAAAAAVVAAFLGLRARPTAAPEPPAALAAPPSAVEVDVSASGRNAVVFRTPDPTITVVWFF